MKRLKLLEVSATVVILMVIGVLAVPAIHRARQASLIQQSGSNLSTLIKAQYNYSISGGGPLYIDRTGKDWWLWFYESRVIEDPALFWCPVRGQGAEGDTHFRGPAREPNLSLSDAVIGCDQPANHAADDPINGVTKAGDVVTIDRGTPEFEKAMSDTSY